MNEYERNKFLAYFAEKIDACAALANTLELDERRDEAVFVKIRLNIYDIFRTVFKTAMNHADADAFFLEKLDQIPRSWRTALELARQHGHSEKAHIEQIKLDTAAEIRSTFDQIREVQP